MADGCSHSLGETVFPEHSTEGPVGKARRCSWAALPGRWAWASLRILSHGQEQTAELLYPLETLLRKPQSLFPSTHAAQYFWVAYGLGVCALRSQSEVFTHLSEEEIVESNLEGHTCVLQCIFCLCGKVYF